MSIWKAYLMPHPPIIIPEIGREDRFESQDTIRAMEVTAKEIMAFEPDLGVIISPHGLMFRDAVSMWLEPELRGDFSQFGHPELKMALPVDLDLGKKVVDTMDREGMPLVVLTRGRFPKRWDQSLDHGIMVPYYFLEKEGTKMPILAFTYGAMPREDLYRFGQILQGVLEKEKKKIAIIASGDLSHCLKEGGPYEYREEGPAFDRELLERLTRKGLDSIMEMDEGLIEGAGQCGYPSLVVLAGLLSGRPVTMQRLSYEGPYGVGYAVVRWETMGQDPYIALAKESIDYYIANRRLMPVPVGLEGALLNKRAGVFVSLHKDGQLRGCIGSIEGGTANIAEEIIYQAVNASQMDPRFLPVQAEELEDLQVSVDILGAPEPVRSLKELDPELYGVIVTKGRRKGLLLPRLEGVDTVEYQLAVALQKAGISPNEDYEVERFMVVRHE